MALRFAAVAGAEPVHCGKTIQGLGRTAASAELRDLRFYVSEIAFIDASGNAVPLRLSRGEWQDGQVALIDLADGRGNCVPSASQTNDVVTGALPRGDYRGLRFTVGVPHALNHSDYASAMPPLDVQAMAWAWQVGRKFMQVEISPTGGVARAASGSAPGRAFLFHLGTTGCRGNPVTGETVHCERSNRAEVVLDRFDPDNDLVALDLAALYRDSDIQRDGGGALLSLRSDTSEMDIYPYRGDYGMGSSANETCPGTGNPLCRYYFGVRPDGRYRIDQANVDLIGKFQAGGLGHTLLVGLDTYRARKTGSTYLQQVSSVDIHTPVLGNTAGLDSAATMPQDYDDYNRWTSLYIQDQIALGNGIFLTGALRHDSTNAVYGTPGTQPNKLSFTTPRLGAVWQFASNQSIYAQYQDSVSANNGRDTVTGASLGAERARQFEIGHKIELLDGRLTSTVALFELTKRNRGAQVTIDQAPYYNIVTIGEARSRGLEWDVSGQLTSRLSLIGSYAYTDAKVVKDPLYQGTQLANVARHTASLWARYAIDSQWSVGGGVFAQGQRQGDSANTFQLPGYARFDAMLAYRFGLGAGKASLQFNLDNVFDRKYYAGSHQFAQDWIKLGTPRTARLTLRVDY